MKIDTLLETEQKSSKVAPWMSWEHKSSKQTPQLQHHLIQLQQYFLLYSVAYDCSIQFIKLSCQNILIWDLPSVVTAGHFLPSGLLW